jgi:acetyl-CoA decarbonylase/synthase complex subunit delta
MIPNVSETSAYQVNQVAIGATGAEGGTRSHSMSIGGAKTLPLLHSDGYAGCRPLIAIDVLDRPPEDWNALLMEAYGDAVKDSGAWAKKAVECGADVVCIVLEGIHADKGGLDAAHAVAAVTQIKKAVGVPLMVWRSEDNAKDNEVLPKVSEALKGERALFGTVTQENYKRLTGVCLADGHALITEAPLDINMAKQVNILVTDMGFPAERLVMYQTTGALGYGIEYAYSIQERQRIAALQGDKMLAMPVVASAGLEAWNAKEAKTPETEMPAWGPQSGRGVMWEAVTALALIHSGADIVRMRHPEAVKIVKQMINRFYPGTV